MGGNHAVIALFEVLRTGDCRGLCRRIGWWRRFKSRRRRRSCHSFLAPRVRLRVKRMAQLLLNRQDKVFTGINLW